MTEIQNVDTKVQALVHRLGASVPEETFSNKQGVAPLIQSFDADILNMRYRKPSCNKDTGEKARLRQRSRGVFITVSGGGNILQFQPLYKSESPSQVFMLTVNLIWAELKSVPEENITTFVDNYILCYDNVPSG